MHIEPISIAKANEYVAKWHRHNKPIRVARFACACVAEGEIVGVAIFGTPSARHLMDGRTGEILRVATNGARNACSMLYSACRKAAFAIGYNRVITYTLHTESGSSLRASGFDLDTTSAGGVAWTNRSGRTDQSVSRELKNRWSATFRRRK